MSRESIYKKKCSIGSKVEVTFDDDTVWLSIDQMADLFQRDKSVIGKHVRNIE